MRRWRGPSAAEALEALAGLQGDARRSGASKTSLTEINREIEAVRRERALRSHARSSVPLALQVLVARYGLDDRRRRRGRSLEEVARAFGLSRVALRRLEGAALVALARLSPRAATLPSVKHGTRVVERSRSRSQGRPGRGEPPRSS